MSGRARIAPVLAGLLDDLVDLGGAPGDAKVLRLAREDFRHLRAVARLMAIQVEFTTKHNPNLKDSPRLAKCRAALARLERASGRKP